MTDEERDRLTKLYRSLFTPMVVGLLIFDALGASEQTTISGLLTILGPSAGIVALMFLSRALVRRGSYHVGVTLTLSTLALGIAFFISFYGVRTPIPFIFIWPIMVSSILLGSISGFIFATVATAIVFTLATVELHQLLPLPIFKGDPSYTMHWHLSSDPVVISNVFSDMATSSVIYFLAAYLSWIYSRNLGQAIDRSEKMIATLQTLANHNATVATKIGTATKKVGTWLEKQQQGAWAQSEAVQKIARSVRALLESSGDIAQRSTEVKESSHKSLENDDRTVENIRTLSTHTGQIDEILEVMKVLANRSDILALNAALEGVKAGEKGEGFIIVAARIQTMAEEILISLTKIRSIISNIHGSSDDAIWSTYEGTELTRRTAELTKEITLITTSQKQGTEQVSLAIEDIETVAQQTVITTTEVLEAMSDLAELTGEIRGLPELGDPTAPDGADTPELT